MNYDDLAASAPGRLVDVLSATGSRGLAFMPHHLPVEINLDVETYMLVEQAAMALGNLNGVGRQIGNPQVFAQPFLRQEAVASTRIEGSQTNLEQLLLFEVDEAEVQPSTDDNREALNYVRALNAGWTDAELSTESRIGMHQLHTMLLDSVRGGEKSPGVFRALPAYLGGTGISTARFVPPPPEFIPELVENLLAFAAGPAGVPRLVQLAEIHYQFETIHPYSDGNGRLGRLLLPLYLKRWGLLDQPLLYLSPYLEHHRRAYVDLLYRVSTEGAWQEWIAFFLEAVRVSANRATDTAHRMLELSSSLRQRYERDRSPHVLPIINHALNAIVVSVAELEELTGAGRSTIYGIMRRLVQDGIFDSTRSQGGTSAYILVPLLNVLLHTGNNDGPGR